ncbi:unnamed protein product [Didymodactylos carnosus]|uniref:Uncharacterized protein n=1 Tax=Didymodactylos carnosus TaxID=1234261 RepID=A0A814WFI4_9BILA|nr:unnamed protein product [Didymodactylos carnosus]CAF1201566.1 unnamed protein product [Didymodactylos carnosus]CAF3849577.1 unnamed protein product [Didymodactylos carnosus]CAF3966033.1 unnamed protein product [Didymodactylos carnosus]
MNGFTQQRINIDEHLKFLQRLSEGKQQRSGITFEEFTEYYTRAHIPDTREISDEIEFSLTFWFEMQDMYFIVRYKRIDDFELFKRKVRELVNDPTSPMARAFVIVEL